MLLPRAPTSRLPLCAVTTVTRYQSGPTAARFLPAKPCPLPGSWVEAPLATPITLAAGTTYRVSAHIPAGTDGYFRTTSWPTNFANGTVGQNFYYSYGDMFPTTVYGTGEGPLVDLRYSVTFSNSITVSPTSSGAFVNGVWSGNVTVGQAATNVVLKADDGAGHVATSSAFQRHRGTSALVAPAPGRGPIPMHRFQWAWPAPGNPGLDQPGELGHHRHADQYHRDDELHRFRDGPRPGASTAPTSCLSAEPKTASAPRGCPARFAGAARPARRTASPRAASPRTPLPIPGRRGRPQSQSGAPPPATADSGPAG